MAHDMMLVGQPSSIAVASSAFIKSLPDGAQMSRDDDRTLISKTSPTVWEYEMFRIEWTRRAVLRYLYEMMREDTRIKRANHVFASTAVRRGFDCRVTSDVSQKEAEKAQDALTTLIRRIQLMAKLPQWARVLLRDGDWFGNPVVDPATRLVMQVKSLPAISIQRNDDITGNFPDLNAAFQQIDPISLQPMLELALWQINHIRWDHEDGERYGRSQYLANLRTWKQLSMAEQDLVVRRRTRAAPKRVHIIGNKDHPASDPEIDRYMERNKLSGSPRDIVTDYFLSGHGEVKDLNADAQLDHIADIQYLQEVHMIGTGTPLGMMGFGQDINRDIIDDQRKQFKEDVEELRRLLEYGDGAAYSGIRAMFDFQLALLEIDPSILDYNIVWFESDNETANDRVNRVTQLRASTPDPLISRKTTLRIIGKDVGLDTDDAVNEEIKQIKAEKQEALQEKQAEQAALNPPGTPQPKPATDATESEGVNGWYRNLNLRATGNNLFTPARDDTHLLQVEQQIRQRVKSLFGTVAHEYVLNNRKRMAKLADYQPTASTGILDSYTVDVDPYTHMLLHRNGHCALTDAKKTFEINAAVYPLLSDLQQKYDLQKQLQELLLNAYQHTQAVVRSPTTRLSALARLGPVATGLAMAGITTPPTDEHGNPLSIPREEPYKPSLQTPMAQPMKHLVTAARPPGTPSLSLVTPQPNAQEVAPALEVQDITAQQLMEKQAAERAAEILQTTEKMLARSLTEALNSGDPVDDWVRRALEVLDIPDWRADMIARTEVSAAFNEALKRLYRDKDVAQVQWVTHMDDRTCPTCASRNGAVFTMDMLPPVPVHPNCRCYTVPIGAQEGS